MENVGYEEVHVEYRCLNIVRPPPLLDRNSKMRRNEFKNKTQYLREGFCCYVIFEE